MRFDLDHIDAQAAKLGTKLKSRTALRSFDGICRMAGEAWALVSCRRQRHDDLEG